MQFTKLRQMINQAFHRRSDRRAVAIGISVGFFWGVSIFWGLQIVLAVAFSSLLRGNRVIAAAMTAVSNPLTTIPLYTSCYFIGRLFLFGELEPGTLPELTSLKSLWQQGTDFFMTMLAGTTLVGLVGGLALFWIFKHDWSFNLFRKSSEHRKAIHSGPI
ncbi:MAG: DUF2062 domain-containing protein [Oligoflexales bacterium]|nr:DUF2062 domain-containing protein [Oligoflexales bacterium]